MGFGLDDIWGGAKTLGGGYLSTMKGLGNAITGQNTSRADQYNDASGSFVSEEKAQNLASQMGTLGLQGSQAGTQNALGVLSGLTPSLAQAQMQQALGQNNQNAMAMAASARGVDPSAAFRQAMMSQQQNAMGTSQAAGILRAQEIAAARNQLLQSGLGQSQIFQNQQDAYANRALDSWKTAQNVNAGITAENAKQSGVYGRALASFGLGKAGAAPTGG